MWSTLLGRHSCNLIGASVQAGIVTKLVSGLTIGQRGLGLGICYLKAIRSMLLKVLGYSSLYPIKLYSLNLIISSDQDPKGFNIVLLERL